MQSLSRLTLPQLKELATRISREIHVREVQGTGALRKKLEAMARVHGLALEQVLRELPRASDPALKRTRPAKNGSSVTTGRKLPIKYMHPSNRTLKWSGRGSQPAWVKAWLSNGGSIDALVNAAAKLGQKSPPEPVADTDAHVPDDQAGD